MSKKNKSNPLKAFTEKLCDVSVLNDTSFNDLYSWHFEDIAHDLREEIIFNLSNLSKDKFDIYITYVKNEIENTYVYDPDICIIEKWLKKFDLVKSDFPFYFDKNVNRLISYEKFNHSLELEEEKIARSIQLEFYWFAVFLEATKMIAFVNSFFFNNIDISDVIENSKINKTELNPIFNPLKGFEVFNYLLEQFVIKQSNINKRGQQAKLKAIWETPISKKKIFREHAELKDYVKFLNDTFNTKYKSKSMSDGYKYHDSIKNWLKESLIE